MCLTVFLHNECLNTHLFYHNHLPLSCSSFFLSSARSSSTCDHQRWYTKSYSAPFEKCPNREHPDGANDLNTTVLPDDSYDIIFTAPRFKADGALDRPATATVLHNGVLVHNATAFYGPTQHKRIDPYSPKLLKGPVMLQDHGNPVRYRNIWMSGSLLIVATVAYVITQPLAPAVLLTNSIVPLLIASMTAL